MRSGVCPRCPACAIVNSRAPRSSCRSEAMRRRSKRIWINWLAPPYHFQTSASPDAYDFEEPLVRVEVEFEERFFDGTRVRDIAREPVTVIELR